MAGRKIGNVYKFDNARFKRSWNIKGTISLKWMAKVL